MLFSKIFYIFCIIGLSSNVICQPIPKSDKVEKNKDKNKDIKIKVEVFKIKSEST